MQDKRAKSCKGLFAGCGKREGHWQTVSAFDVLWSSLATNFVWVMNQYFWMLVDCSQLWEEGQTRVSFLSGPCRMPIVLILKCFSNFAPWFNHLTGPNDKPHLSSCFNDKTSFIKDPGKLLFVKLDYSTIAPGQGNKRAQQAAPEFAEFVCTMREKRQTLFRACGLNACF